MHGKGDVKTNCSRYPVAELKAACGPESGDWVVATSTLEINDKAMPIFALAHRRGPAIHTYLSSHGRSIRGKDQKHKDDVDDQDSAKAAPARKCPLVLNDWSAVQPWIDMNNKWRQAVLAIEERFTTKSFPYRALTTLIGITFVDSYMGFNFFMTQQYHDNFKLFIKHMALAGMHNNLDSQSDPYRSVPLRDAQAQSGSPQRASPRKAAKHKAIPVRLIRGWKGSSEGRCTMCGLSTTTVCAECSTPTAVVWLHGPETKYKQHTTTHTCPAEHGKCPDKARFTAAKPSSSKGKGTKRARSPGA